MNCATHNDVAAVAFCRTCGKPLCQNCTRDVRGVIYCEACLAARMEGTASAAGFVPPVQTVYLPMGSAPPGPRPPLNSGPNPAVAGILAGFFPIGVGAVYTGQYAKGLFYVPMATSEGALIRSYERGMVALTRAGGVQTALLADENQIVPTFFFPDVASAAAFSEWIPGQFEHLRIAAESTTRHGKLTDVKCYQVGRQVLVNLGFSTGDAQGMNMIVKATDAVCRWVQRNYEGASYFLFSGLCSEKRASGFLMTRGKGKRADYILYYKPNIPIALIEAKDNTRSVGDGIQQGLDYAATLEIPFVFSSNGDGFVFHDRTGISRDRAAQPAGQALRGCRRSDLPGRRRRAGQRGVRRHRRQDQTRTVDPRAGQSRPHEGVDP